MLPPKAARVRRVASDMRHGHFLSLCLSIPYMMNVMALMASPFLDNKNTKKQRHSHPLAPDFLYRDKQSPPQFPPKKPQPTSLIAPSILRVGDDKKTAAPKRGRRWKKEGYSVAR